MTKTGPAALRRLAVPCLAVTIGWTIAPVAPCRAAGDHRALAGVQPFVKDAPVTRLRVADTSRMKGADKDPEQRQWMWADAGCISRNIRLFCAGEGLATGARALIDRPALAKAPRLSDDRVILLAQSVGSPSR